MLGHASFVLVAVSYAVDDYLMLRVIAVAGSTSMLFFTYFHPHGRVLWLPFQWNMLFIALNCYRIGKALVAEHNASQLSEEMIRLQKEFLPAVRLVDFDKLVGSGEVVEYRVGDEIVGQGESSPYVYMVIEGKLVSYRDHICTYKIERGDFLMENGIHVGLGLVGHVDSSAKVLAAGNQGDVVRVFRWDRTKLNRLLRHTPSLDASLQSVISLDIVRKLKKQRTMLTKKDVENPELWTEKRIEQNFSRYVNILKNVLTHRGHLQRVRKQLETYRLIHDIDDSLHLEALQQCGWTLKEYTLGYRRAAHVQKKPTTIKVADWK